MPDHRQIIDQLRAILQSGDQTRSDRMEQVAADYASACEEVNQRLGRCQWLLQEGLRSEAIQLADAEPRLLDAVAALDFRERPEWDELVGIYGLAPAPRLLVEVASFLNEAYAQEEPLQELLVKHRRLAMQRSPLRLRLVVMRQLAAQDPNNLVWADDLHVFEKTRFRQIQVEAAEAARLNDPAHIARLLAEIQQQTWVETPPKALVQGLAKADAQLRGQQTRATMAELDSRLNEAFAARDPIRGRIVRNDWLALAASSPPDPGDPIWERVGPALRWLDEEDRRDADDRHHEASLGALVKALDDPAFIPPAELERLGQAVFSHGRGLPQDVQQRFLARLQSAETGRSYRLRLLIAGSAAGLLAASLVVFTLVRGHLRAGEAAEAAVSIADLIELGQLDRAGEFLATLEKTGSSLLGYPPLIEARQRYQAARDRDTERSLQFDQAMRLAEQAPLHEPDPEALQTARSLARRETEKQAIAGLIERRRSTLQAERAWLEMALGPRIDQMKQELYRIDRLLESPPVDESAVDASLSDMKRGLVEMAPQLAMVGEELKGLAQGLGQKLETCTSRLAKVHQQSRILEEINAAVTFSPAAPRECAATLAQKLQDYIKADPDSPRAEAFREVLKECPLWESLDAWNRIASGWRPVPQGLAPAIAKARAAECAAFLAQHPAFPNAVAVAAYQRYAEAIARRAAGGEDTPQSRILRLLTDILVDNVWMVTVVERRGDGGQSLKKYYTTGRPAERNASLQFVSLISFSGKEKARSFHVSLIGAQGLSPQSKIAAAFKPRLLDASKVSRWEEVMREMVSRILDEPDIEPILQVALLRRVLDSAIAASEPLKAAFGPMKTRLDAADVDINVPWMDPDTENLDRSQARAARAVDTVRTLLPKLVDIDAIREKIERGILPTYPVAGWLVRDRDDWTIRTGRALPAQGDLWVVVFLQKSSTLRKLGRIVGGKPAIEARDSAILAEGRPVYLVRESR